MQDFSKLCSAFCDFSASFCIFNGKNELFYFFSCIFYANVVESYHASKLPNGGNIKWDLR